MFAYYNGNTETGAPCQPHLCLRTGYRYRIKSFYSIGDETFVELKGVDNRLKDDANPGFNLKWFSIQKPIFAFSKEKPMRNDVLEIETIRANGKSGFSNDVIKVLDVEQVSVDTYNVFANNYMSYIVQVSETDK